MTKKEVIKRLALILITGTSVLFLIATVLAVGTGYFLYSQAKIFSNHAGISLSEMRTLAELAWDKQVIASNNQKTILILGVDSMANRGDAPPLTDTMMLANININSGEINTLSLPRDLWSDEYQTKINALYYYGQDRFPEEPEHFPEETLESMFDLEIHHTVVISMDSLAELVDMVGGIEVDVPIGFTDTQFPRSDVDITVERDPEKLYKTVSFEPGKQIMNGEQTLEYIRSRHSEDDEGHDLARSKRQQLVINALMSKLMSAETLTNPALLGELFKYYQTHYDRYIPLLETVALAKQLVPNYENIALQPHSLSIYPEAENGAIWHPEPREYDNQWVYAVREPTELKNEVTGKLYDL